MPYIKQNDRTKFSDLECEIMTTPITTPGELNYLITRLIQKYAKSHGKKYQAYNDVIGALEGAKLELYRRFVSSYEDDKIEFNGDVNNITGGDYE